MLQRLALFAVLSFARPVLADGFDYAVNGNGCVPDNLSIQSDLYENRGHGVGFKPGKVGTIRLTCPITLGRHQDMCWGCSVGSSGYEWSSYTVLYKDTDGEKTNGFINIQLRYANFNAPDVGLTWVNSTLAMPATWATSFKVGFKNVDPGLSSLWWFEVKLTRKSAESDVELLGLTLQ